MEPPVLPVPQVPAAGADVKATPTAKNVARAQKVSIEAVSGSGAGGRVTKHDVLRAAAPAAPAAAADARVVCCVV